MTKEELLDYLASAQTATAEQAALDLGILYPAAAMAFLRLSRQGLMKRYIDPETGIYWYCLSARGCARLEFFHS